MITTFIFLMMLVIEPWAFIHAGKHKGNRITPLFPSCYLEYLKTASHIQGWSSNNMTKNIFALAWK